MKEAHRDSLLKSVCLAFSMACIIDVFPAMYCASRKQNIATRLIFFGKTRDVAKTPMVSVLHLEIYGTPPILIDSSFSNLSSSSCQYYTMIQQRLPRTLRLLSRQQRQCLRIQRSPISTSYTPRALAPPVLQRISQQRWYSQAQEAESKKEETPEATTSEEQKPAQEEQKEDPVQKELDTKKREVIDLTVCSPTQL